MNNFLNLTSLKYLVRKNKDQSRLKKMLRNRCKNQSRLKKKMRERERERELQKPLWFEINKKEFE